MKKYFVKYYTGFVGEEGTDVLEFPDDEPMHIIEQVAWEQAVQWAEMFREVIGDDVSDEELEEMDEDGQNYTSIQDVDFFLEEYDSEKHDCLL